MINSGSYRMLEDLAVTMAKEFNPYGYRVQTRRVGYWLLYLGKFFDSQVNIVLPMMNIKITASNQLSKDLLGMTYDKYSFKETMVDMGYSLIDRGLARENLLK
jgi:hypothetical protein